MTNAQKTKALKILGNAYTHLIQTREWGTTERAQTIIAEASRMIRCGFRTPITYEYFGFDTVCEWNGGKGLYPVDSIEVK